MADVVAAAEKKAEHESDSEAADVRHVSDPASPRLLEGSRVLTEDLNHDPKAEHDDRRKLNRSPEESERQQCPNSISRKHYQVGPKHSGDRARRA